MPDAVLSVNPVPLVDASVPAVAIVPAGAPMGPFPEGLTDVAWIVLELPDGVPATSTASPT